MLSRNLKLFFGKRKWLQNDKTSRGFNLLLNLNYWFWRVKRFVMQCVHRERGTRENKTLKAFLTSTTVQVFANVIMMHEKLSCLPIQWCIGSLPWGIFSAYPHHQSTFISQLNKDKMLYIHTQRKAQNWRGHGWGQWLIDLQGTMTRPRTWFTLSKIICICTEISNTRF